MILFDLQLLLFLILLGIGGGLTTLWWLMDRRRRQGPHPFGDSWQGYTLLPFGIVVLGPDAQIVFSNEPAQRLLSLNHEPDAVNPLLRQLSAGLSEATPRSGLLSQPSALRWWSFPLDTHETLLVLADGGEQQRALRRQQAVIGQLSHELRTPLTALLAHAEIAHNPQTEIAVRQASLETIQRETHRMARLVRDLLELHRLETAEDLLLQPTDLTLVAEEAMAQLILRAEACGLSMTLEADTRLPRVLAQPDRLKQVFLNLLDNAITYGRPGDQICVRLEKLSALEVRCSVQDTGPGITEADLPHVTERLYRGRKDREGSGLGLAIVCEILRRHHTTLTITSTAVGAETGTTMSWVLPIAASGETAADRGQD